MTETPPAYQQEPPDFSPQSDVGIEWWFVQGRIEASDGPGVHHVMAAFFRIHGIDNTGPPGTMLLQHVVDERSGYVQVDSRVTPQTVAHHLDIAGRVARAAFPPGLRELALWRHRNDNADWIRANAVTVDPEEPRVGAAPFHLGWNGFALEEAPGGLSLRMGDGGAREIALRLEPESLWLNASSDQLHPDLTRNFGYQCCPRLQAEGHFGTEAVTGQFWVDRQWGHYDDWLLARQADGYRVLGWDWIGVNLDDGRDLMICRHRDARHQSLRCQWGIMFEGGVPRQVGRVETRALRSWTSPRGAARYPVAWEVELPEIGLRGRVEPVIEDQEIPVYGTFAIWEGAARFEGSEGGRALSGRGRLELVGYGAPLTVAEHLRRRLTRLTQGWGPQSGAG